MYLTSFLGAIKSAAQKHKASFLFPYSQQIWHLAVCLKRNKLIRQYSIHIDNQTGRLYISVYLAYQRASNNTAICPTIRYYSKQSLTVKEIRSHRQRTHNLFKPLLIGWSVQHQTFCTVDDFAQQKTGLLVGFQRPIFVVE